MKGLALKPLLMHLGAAGVGKVAAVAVVAVIAVSGAVVVTSDLNNDDNKTNSNQGGSDQGGSKGDGSEDIDKTSYTITLLTDGDGDVTGGGTYEGGTTVTVRAVGKNGQEFYQWNDGNTDATRTINVTTNLSLTAYFASFYDISASASPDSAGTLTGADKHIRNGQSVTLTATAASGYKFSHWEEDGSSVSEESKYTFTVSKDRALVAVFEVDESGDVKTTYTITLNTSGNGTVTGANKYDEGTEITVTATATSGYKFSYWSENGNKVSEESSYTFTVSADRTLTAVFEVEESEDVKTTHTITLIAGDGGTVNGANTYDEGTEITVTATAASGYKFSYWSENGSNVSANSSYRFTVSADRTLTAVFEKETYTITLTKSHAEGGTVSGEGSYPFNDTATLTVSAASNYSFDGWFLGSERLSSSTTYQYKVTGNATIEARFTYSASHDASFTMTSAKPYMNELITFTANSVEGVSKTVWTLTSNTANGLNLSDVTKNDLSCSFKTAEYADMKITRTVTYDDGETATYSEDLEIYQKEYHMYWKFRCDSLTSTSTLGASVKNNKEGDITLVLSYKSFLEYTNTYVGDRCIAKATNPNNLITVDDPVMQTLIAYIKEITAGMTDLEKVNCALKAAQSLKYAYDRDTHGSDYYKFPIESLWEENGDCEDHSILFCTLANGLGFDTVQYYIKTYKKDMYTPSGAHMAPGVEVPGASGYYTIVDGVKYYYAEATATYAATSDKYSAYVGYQNPNYVVQWAYKGTGTSKETRINDVVNGNDSATASMAIDASAFAKLESISLATYGTITRSY